MTLINLLGYGPRLLGVMTDVSQIPGVQQAVRHSLVYEQLVEFPNASIPLKNPQGDIEPWALTLPSVVDDIFAFIEDLSEVANAADTAINLWDLQFVKTVSGRAIPIDAEYWYLRDDIARVSRFQNAPQFDFWVGGDSPTLLPPR